MRGSIEKCWPKRLFFGQSGYQVLNCARRRHRRSLLSATGGRYAVEFFEVAREVAAVADAYLIHRFFDAEVSCLEQHARAFEPGVHQVLGQRLSGVMFEEVTQARRRKVYEVSHLLGAQVPMKLTLNERLENLNSYIHESHQQSQLKRSSKNPPGKVFVECREEDSR